MNKNKLLRACPVCQNTGGGEVLHTQKFVLPDNHVLPKEYDIVVCGGCGFIYADTRAGQDAYDKYYSEMSKYDTNYINSDTSLFVDRAVWISRFIDNKKASIIDVGCGNGQLLLELEKIGFSNLTALDPSSACIDAIRRRGICGIVSSIFDVLPDKKYDNLILSGVLEHIYDINKIMQTIKLLLKPNGLLFVCVPDASRYLDYDTVAYDYFNIEHINHFDETSLISLGFLHGLNMESFIKTDITLPGSKQPVIFCVYRNGDKTATDWKNYPKVSIVNYIEKTGKKESANRIIDKLVESKEEVIIWGAGNYASRLLATSNLAKCNILMFVDNDKHKQGVSIAGRPVCAPENISSGGKTATILVTAAVFHEEIFSEIRSMGIGNKVIILK